MAQKIYPRSLRSQGHLAADFSFFSEHAYVRVWMKTYQLANHLWMWSQKNLVHKAKRKSFGTKRPGKKLKFPAFLTTRWHASNLVGSYQVAPLLFKFAHLSFAKKYNPLKSTRKVRRSVAKPLSHRSFKPRNPGFQKKAWLKQGSRVCSLERWLSGL